MPALPADQRFPSFVEGPEEAHVPRESFAHRAEDAAGPVVHACRLAQGVGDGEPDVAVLFAPLPFAHVPEDQHAPDSFPSASRIGAALSSMGRSVPSLAIRTV